MPQDPFRLFDSWFGDARKAGIPNAEAMTLATSTKKGIPSARVVLFKGMVRGGFAFYTNYLSRKSKELDANPHAALVFHWDSLARQIRIEGRIERCTPRESDRYFATRERGSQLGAWASIQSAEIKDRVMLETALAEIEARFAGKARVTRPPFWGGYRLVPKRIEFWQGRAHRLHERTLFTRSTTGRWKTAILSP